MFDKTASSLKALYLLILLHLSSFFVRPPKYLYVSFFLGTAFLIWLSYFPLFLKTMPPRTLIHILIAIWLGVFFTTWAEESYNRYIAMMKSPRDKIVSLLDRTVRRLNEIRED
jgi:hypothetical protein